MTLLGWILGGIGLAIGVWFFLIFMDWLTDLGQDITEEQARQQARTMHLRSPDSSQPRPQRHESTVVKP